MNSSISIVVPCFNQAAYLTEALDSVLAQSYKEWECIIVSDGSTDNTAEIAKLYTEKDARIKFIAKPNGGPSSARNVGIRNAVTDYILPLDADDKISPNYIEEAMAVMQSSSDITLVYGSGEKFGLINQYWNLKEYSWEKLLFDNMIHPCGLFKKKDWEAIGGYDESMTYGIEDWEFWINLIKKTGKVVCLKSITFYWRIKANSRTTNINSWKESKMKQHIYKKHAELYEELFIDPLKVFEEKQLLATKIASIEKQPFKYAFFVIAKRFNVSNKKKKTVKVA